MIELIEEIVAAEREADDEIRKAKDEAADRKRSAEEELQTQISEARDIAKHDAKTRVEEARSRISASASRTSGTDTSAARYIEEHTQLVETLVEEIVGTVFTTEIETP